jgi:hypothetical protein
MRLGRAGKLIDVARSVGQPVGNAEPGRDVDRLRDPIAPDEGQDLLSSGRLERHSLDAGWSRGGRPAASGHT